MDISGNRWQVRRKHSTGYQILVLAMAKASIQQRHIVSRNPDNMDIFRPQCSAFDHVGPNVPTWCGVFRTLFCMVSEESTNRKVSIWRVWLTRVFWMTFAWNRSIIEMYGKRHRELGELGFVSMLFSIIERKNYRMIHV